jgi:GT2 family glycosyltransferase
MDYSNISVVVSSHLSDQENSKFTQHIKNTIGIVNPEIIIYENFNEYSLTEIYNIGLNQSKNDIVVFIHNDLFFNTKNWGKILLGKFSKTEYGILGLAGTTDLNENGIWWGDNTKMIGIVNHKHNNRTFESKYSNSYGKNIIDVVTIDGLFIGVNKNKLQKGFVEEFNGFHYYDISFCVENLLNGVKIGVIFDITVTHNSIGQTNDEFEKNRQIFIKKYEKNLPLKINVEEIRDINIKLIKIKKKPLLSIAILHKNNNDLLFNLLKSIKEKTTYDNYHIYIADTGSDIDKLNELEEYIEKDDTISLSKYNNYHFAKSYNDMVRNDISKDTEIILFLNNDVEFINDVITIMVDTYNKNINVGTVGARLYYKDNSIQHSGISLIKKQDNYYLTHYGIRSYYKYHKDTVKNTFGNTAACMLTSYSLFKKLGMFNEGYIECFEDVEYNIECILNKRTNIFCGNAIAYHYESQTRNLDDKKNEKMTIDYNKIVNKIKDNPILDKFAIKYN